jgi:chromosome partitioning protein
MIITITNAKGGVGKTTCCINIGHGLVMNKKKVLVIDLDSQASASLALGLSREELSPSSAEVLMENQPIKEAIRQSSIAGLDILPGSMALANYDISMANRQGREKILKEVLKDIHNEYDYILIDCAPSVGLLPINALVAADKYIVPTTPEYLSLEGLVNFTETVERVKAGMGAKCELLGIVLTRVDRRTSASKEIISMIKEQFQNAVFTSVIHQNVKISEAPSFGKTIFQYDWNSVGAECYQALCKELIQKLKKEGSSGQKNRKEPSSKTKK